MGFGPSHCNTRLWENTARFGLLSPTKTDSLPSPTKTQRSAAVSSPILTILTPTGISSSPICHHAYGLHGSSPAGHSSTCYTWPLLMVLPHHFLCASTMGFNYVHCHLDAFATRWLSGDLSELKQLLNVLLLNPLWRRVRRLPISKKSPPLSDFLWFCQVGVWLYIYLAVIIEEVPLPNIGTSSGCFWGQSLARDFFVANLQSKGWTRDRTEFAKVDMV